MNILESPKLYLDALSFSKRLLPDPFLNKSSSDNNLIFNILSLDTIPTPPDYKGTFFHIKFSNDIKKFFLDSSLPHNLHILQSYESFVTNIEVIYAFLEHLFLLNDCLNVFLYNNNIYFETKYKYKYFYTQK